MSALRAMSRHFMGTWPGSPYTLSQTWWTTERPSRCTRKQLIPAMATTISYAQRVDDWRCMKGVLKNNERYLAEGGYKNYAGFVAGE